MAHLVQALVQGVLSITASITDFARKHKTQQNAAATHMSSLAASTHEHDRATTCTAIQFNPEAPDPQPYPRDCATAQAKTEAPPKLLDLTLQRTRPLGVLAALGRYIRKVLSSVLQDVQAVVCFCFRRARLAVQVAEPQPVTTTRTTTSFLDLPAEIRLVIYDIIFETALQPTTLVRSHCLPLPPLLRAARFLRSEALALWEAHLQSATMVQLQVQAGLHTRWLELGNPLIDPWLSADEIALRASELDKESKEARQRLSDLWLLVDLAEWIGHDFIEMPGSYLIVFERIQEIHELLAMFGEDISTLMEQW